MSKIPTRAVPPKLAQQTLYALGYKSTRERPIRTILKFINFLDQNYVPTENYRKFRSKKLSGVVMADCIRTAYKDLYSLYTDAHNRSTTELKDFFSTRITGGDKVLTQTVSTFKAICEFADFKKIPVIKEARPEAEVITPTPVSQVSLEQPTAQLPLTVNIQIQLPVTENVEVYEKIFEALRKHLIRKGISTS